MVCGRDETGGAVSDADGPGAADGVGAAAGPDAGLDMAAAAARAAWETALVSSGDAPRGGVGVPACVFPLPADPAGAPAGCAGCAGLAAAAEVACGTAVMVGPVPPACDADPTAGVIG